jgi:hypothetical protein
MDWGIWGFIDGVFIPPIILLGDLDYPESFQSTGQKDKKDAEVWRGSIIRWDDDIVGVVVWDDNGWDCRIIGGDLNRQFCSLGDVELYGIVIGDTTTTPELLVVEK